MDKNKKIILVIDEKTADFLTAVMNNVDKSGEIESIIKVLNCEKEASAFWKSFANGVHENDWCKDPNCEKKSNGK